MTHPLILAAEEFQQDEARREKRGQALRMPDLLAEAHLRAAVNAAASTSADQIYRSEHQDARGHLAVDIFGYTDTFDENAATVITDILHAVEAAGYSPQAVLNQAAAYYAEEL